MTTPVEPERQSPFFPAAATTLIALGVVLGPVAAGATEAWSACALQSLAAIAAILWAISRPKRLWLLTLPAGVVLLGILQLVPLPGPVLAAVSPLSFEADAALGRVGLSPVLACVSVNPGATLAATRLILVLAVTVAVVADVTRDRRRRHALAWSVAAAGIVVLVLGIAFSGHKMGRPSLGRKGGVLLGLHDMSGPIRPWKNPLLEPAHSAGFGYPDVVQVGAFRYVLDAPVVGDVFGSYVNSNHFAGLIGLTLPVGLGLLFGRRVASRRAAVLLWTLALVWAGAAMATVLWGAGSVAGASSLLIAGPAVGALAAGRRMRIVWRIVIALLVLAVAWGLAVAVGWMGARPPETTPEAGAQSGVVRLLQKNRKSGLHRFAAWNAAGAMLRQSPLLGVGLGNYGTAHPWATRKPVAMYYAHNDYVQFVAEAGAVGAAIGLGLAALLFRRLRRRWNGLESPSDRALRWGVVGAMVSAAVHALWDWNMGVPANAFLAAVLLGLLLGTVDEDEPARANDAPDNRRSPRRWGRRLALSAVAAAMGTCVVTAVLDTLTSRWIAPLRLAVALQCSRLPLTPTEKREMLASTLPWGIRAARWAPLSSSDAATVGQAYLHLSGGEDSPELVEARRWLGRSLELCPILLHDGALGLVQDGLGPFRVVDGGQGQPTGGFARRRGRLIPVVELHPPDQLHHHPRTDRAHQRVDERGVAGVLADEHDPVGADEIDRVGQPRRQQLDHLAHDGVRSVETYDVFEQGAGTRAAALEEFGRTDAFGAAGMAAVAGLGGDVQTRVAQLVAADEASAVRFPPHEHRRAELAIVQVDQQHVLVQLMVMLLEPSGGQGVHVVVDRQRLPVGHVEQRIERDGLLPAQRRGENDPPLDRVDEAGGAQPDRIGSIGNEGPEQVVGGGDGAVGVGDPLALCPSERLSLQIEPAGLDVAGPDGESHDAQPRGVDTQRDAWASRTLGLCRAFAQQPYLQHRGNVVADRIGARSGPLVELPATQRTFAANQAKDFALLGREERPVFTHIVSNFCL